MVDKFEKYYDVKLFYKKFYKMNIFEMKRICFHECFDVRKVQKLFLSNKIVTGNYIETFNSLSLS